MMPGLSRGGVFACNDDPVIAHHRSHTPPTSHPSTMMRPNSATWCVPMQRCCCRGQLALPHADASERGAANWIRHGHGGASFLGWRVCAELAQQLSGGMLSWLQEPQAAQPQATTGLAYESQSFLVGSSVCSLASCALHSCHGGQCQRRGYALREGKRRCRRTQEDRQKENTGAEDAIVATTNSQGHR